MMIKVCGLDFKNPIIPASGTFGYGYEFGELYDLNKLGSIALKAATVSSRFGNPLPRIAEVEGGMINAIGLQNPGVDVICSEELEKLRPLVDYKVIANVSGFTIEEYVTCAMRLDQHDMVGILEINVSCPNVHADGVHFGNDIKLLTDLIKAIKLVVKKPVFVKLSPNVSDIVSVSMACESAGCDGLVMINTLVGMKIDIKNARPVIANKVGGLSGSGIKPVAVRMIYQVYQRVNIPIIGVGGISCVDDVIEMMMAGASLVQIGTANLIDPYVCSKIVDELMPRINELGYENICDIIGVVHE